MAHLGLVPAPVGALDHEKTFRLESCAGFEADGPLLAPARLLAQYLNAGCGLNLRVSDASAAGSNAPSAPGGLTGSTGLDGATVRVASPASIRYLAAPDLPGGYRLDISAQAGITVWARDSAGGFAATATLRQLAGTEAFRAASSPRDHLDFGAVSLHDSPRFGWRGVLLDVARHFLPKADLLRYIDYLAAHKFNVLHLHLTDDQGWRIEIKRYPKLTEVGGWRTESNVGSWRHNRFDGRPHGGFYTQDDLREIVAFAAARGVTVLPEIDVPGHSEAAIAAYPELGCATTGLDSGRGAGPEPATVRTTWGISTRVLRPTHETLAFFKDVFTEVMDIFPGPYIGLGGDEVPPLLWRQDPQTVAFSRAVGVGSVDDLHGWFLGQLAEFVLAHDRRPVVWDEGVSQYLPTRSIVTTWRGYASGVQAMAQGYDIVLAPEQDLYLDHRAAPGNQEPIPVGFVRTLEQVYGFEPELDPKFDPAPVLDPEVAGNGPGRLLGIQAQLWSEQLDNPRRLDYAAFPRLCAVAEVAWSVPLDRTAPPVVAEFVDRLATSHLPRLAAAGIEFRPLAGPQPWQQRPGVQGWPRDLEQEIAESDTGAFVGGWHEGMDIG